MISRTTHPNYARNVSPTVDTVHGRACTCHSCRPLPVERITMPAETHAGVPVSAFRKDR